MVILVEAVSNMASSRLSLSNQGTPIDECGEAPKEHSEGVSLELQGEEEELKQGVQQEEEVKITEQEEVVEAFGEVDQEMDSIIEEFLSTIESSPIGFDIEIKEEDAQPLMPLVSNEEEIELEASHQEEEVKVEESCKEVEVIKEEYKGVELARPLETSLPKSPSNTTFKWVKFISLSFNFSLEYGLLKTNGQLRALLWSQE